MISVQEFLMKRDLEYPLTPELLVHLATTMAAVNYLRGRYNKPLMVSSGYRPDRYNTQAGGAKNSPHLKCQAVDILDSSGEFADWCMENEHELAKAGLYMEHPDYTVGWVHLQTVRPRSGSRYFIPYGKKTKE